MPNTLMQLRNKYHDYRRLMDVRAEPIDETGDLVLYGVPVEFNKPYLLFEYNGKKVYEVIERGSFDDADYVDVPLKYNHGDCKGTPARTTSKTERGRLTISVLQNRVETRMNLLHTSGGKDLYMEVESRTVPQMSWAFIQDRESEVMTETVDSITFTVRKVLRVFDISAVDFGANSDTTIYARRYGELDERAKQLDELKCQALRKKIQILSKI